MATFKTDYNTLQKMTKRFAPNVTHSDYKMGKGTPDGDFNWEVETEFFDTVIVRGSVLFTRDCDRWKASEVIENPTIADALKAMEQSIHDLEDKHHVFFEGFELSNPVKGVWECEIITGS